MERYQEDKLFGGGLLAHQSVSSVVGTSRNELEKQMLNAATVEALSLAWLSATPKTTFPVILETKIRDAEAYLRRQEVIRGKTERIVSMAF